MSSKKAILVFVGLILIAGISLVIENKFNFLPSEEMRTLRQIEKEFELPTPKIRVEKDLGANTDFKGANHYTRHIYLAYDNQDMNKIRLFLDELPSQAWVNVSDDKDQYQRYIHESKKSCISVGTDQDSTNSLPYTVFIQSPMEYGCEKYFQN